MKKYGIFRIFCDWFSQIYIILSIIFFIRSLLMDFNSIIETSINISISYLIYIINSLLNPNLKYLRNKINSETIDKYMQKLFKAKPKITFIKNIYHNKNKAFFNNNNNIEKNKNLKKDLYVINNNNIDLNHYDNKEIKIEDLKFCSYRDVSGIFYLFGIKEDNIIYNNNNKEENININTNTNSNNNYNNKNTNTNTNTNTYTNSNINLYKKKTIEKKSYIKLDLNLEFNFVDNISKFDYYYQKENFKNIINYNNDNNNNNNDKKNKYINKKKSLDKNNNNNNNNHNNNHIFFDFKESLDLEGGFNKYNLIKISENKNEFFLNFYCYLIFTFIFPFIQFYKIYIDYISIHKNLTIKKIISTRYDININPCQGQGQGPGIILYEENGEENKINLENFNFNFITKTNEYNKVYDNPNENDIEKADKFVKENENKNLFPLKNLNLNIKDCVICINNNNNINNNKNNFEIQNENEETFTNKIKVNKGIRNNNNNDNDNQNLNSNNDKIPLVPPRSANNFRATLSLNKNEKN
jgi:hypothetical protein